MYAVLLRKGVHSLLAVCLAFVGVTYGVVPVVALGAILLGFFLASRTWRHLDVLDFVAVASFGELFLAVGVIVTALLFLVGGPNAFLGGLLILAFADPMAALVGKTYGKRPYTIFGEIRTYEGSLTCLLVSALIMALFGVPWYLALFAGLILAVVEALTPRGSDNLFLPVVAALILSIFV